VLSEDGSGDFYFGRKESGNGELNYPTDVIQISDLNYIVADHGNHHLVVFSSTGEFMKNLGGGKESGPIHFQNPYSLVGDEDGVLFVSDSSNHRVQVLKQDGTFLRFFGTSGFAVGKLSYHGMALTSEGDVVVVDYGNN